MSYSHRIFIYGPVGLLLLVAVLYSVYWKTSADMLAARLDRANGGEIMPGVVFAFAHKTMGGYPFRLDAVLDGVTVAHEGPGGETAWRSEKVALHALSYNGQLFILEAAGLQSVAEPGEDGAPPRVITFTPGTAQASAVLHDGTLTRFDLDLQQVRGKDASLGAAPDRNFSAGRAQFHLLGNPDKTISVALKIENADIGNGYHPELGPNLALLTAIGKIAQAQSFDGLRRGAQSPLTAVDEWREAHGKIVVDTLAVRWNGVILNAKGELRPTPRDLAGGFQGTMNGIKAFAQAITRNQSPRMKAAAMKVVDGLSVKEPLGADISLRQGEIHVRVDLLPGLIGTL